jgi:NTE family protein
MFDYTRLSDQIFLLQIFATYIFELLSQCMKKKVQLVLGCGGARGIAHIGVIDRLLEDGYEIVEVYGCSMGAVIGGMYCAGFLPQYREWLVRQTKSDIYRLFDITFSMSGFVKGERIFGVLEQLAGKQQIETLPIPFVAVATDMLSRKEVYFKTGDLYKALRASTGLPGVFKPVADGKCLYVDGGVLNPLPVNLAKRRDDAMIVAVNLNGPMLTKNTISIVPENKVPAEIESDTWEMVSRLRRYLSMTPKEEAVEPSVTLPKEPPPPSFSMFEILDAAIDTTMDRLAEVMLQIYPADVLIEIPRNAASVFEFYRAAELIEVGKAAYDKGMQGKTLGKNG